VGAIKKKKKKKREALRTGRGKVEGWQKERRQENRERGGESMRSKGARDVEKPEYIHTKAKREGRGGYKISAGLGAARGTQVLRRS